MTSLPHLLRHACACALAAVVVALAACVSAPLPPPKAVSLTDATPEQMVATIRAAAGSGDGELAVQPLRDPQVEDLRETAQRLETQRHYDDAAKALDQALAIVADDPALLQERAEAAMLQKDYGNAETLARRAFEAGSRVGPLCRRHWATIQQTRLVAGDLAGATDARTRIPQCKVAGVERY